MKGLGVDSLGVDGLDVKRDSCEEAGRSGPWCGGECGRTRSGQVPVMGVQILCLDLVIGRLVILGLGIEGLYVVEMKITDQGVEGLCVEGLNIKEVG